MKVEIIYFQGFVYNTLVKIVFLQMEIKRIELYPPFAYAFLRILLEKS